MKDDLQKEFEEIFSELNIQIEKVEPGQGGLQVGDFFIPADQVFDYLFENLKSEYISRKE